MVLTTPTCASRCRTHLSEHAHWAGSGRDIDYIGLAVVLALPFGLYVGLDLDKEDVWSGTPKYIQFRHSRRRPFPVKGVDSGALSLE